MNTPTITEATIRLQVDRFYGKVRKDTQLAPIFNGAIGTDEAEWQPHLQRMYDFWSSIMLGSRKYRGNPMKKHQDLPAFDAALFDRWLALFEETARELHTPKIAERYIAKSKVIAESLKYGLYFRPADSIAG
jgi:hemoglobin